MTDPVATEPAPTEGGASPEPPAADPRAPAEPVSSALPEVSEPATEGVGEEPLEDVTGPGEELERVSIGELLGRDDEAEVPETAEVPASTEAEGAIGEHLEIEAPDLQGEADLDDAPSGGYHRRLTTRLGRLLLDNDLITKKNLEQALQEQAGTGERLGHYLVEKGYVEESDLIEILSKQYGVPPADLDNAIVSWDALQLIPVDMARRYLVVPVAVKNGAIDVAMVDPSDVVAISNIKFATGHRPQPLIATERAVQEAIRRLYGVDEVGEPRVSSASEAHDEIKRMLLQRDKEVLSVLKSPEKAYELAIAVDEFGRRAPQEGTRRELISGHPAE